MTGSMEKRIRCFFVIILLLMSVAFGMAQNGSWWEPATPFEGDTLTIFFDPTQSAEMPDNPASLTLHWGVNQTSAGKWQQPPSSIWPPGTVPFSDGIAVRSPMTKVSANLWKIQIVTNLSIKTLHYVVNDGTPSATGSNWAHNIGGTNWDVTLFPPGLTTILISPTVSVKFGDPARSPVFVNPTDTLKIQVTAAQNGTVVDHFSFLIDSVFSAQAPGDTATFSFFAASAAPGLHQLALISDDAKGTADTLQFAVMVNSPPQNIPPPPNTKMGINYRDIFSADLALFAPRKQFVYVIGDFNDWKVNPAYQMNRYEISPDSVVFWIHLSNLSPGAELAYQYLVDGNIRIADPYTEKVLDPWNDSFIQPSTYPNLKPYPTGKTEEPVGVLQTAQSDYSWQYDAVPHHPNKKKLVIYELLVRDFVGAHDYKTLIDSIGYFQKLGVNAIELMPITEFEGNLSWGYNPSFYFAPDKYYGPANDLKRFIDTAHSKGIAVILDMVLNHSFGQSPLVRLYWDGQNNRPAADNPWYNVVSPNPVFSFGFDFNHESPNTRAFVDRVNRFWLEKYHVDGYRFDFTKGFTNTPGDGSQYDPSRIAILERMADQIWAFDSTAYVILEHFAPNQEEKELSAYGRGMMLWGNANYNYNEATMGYNTNGKSDFSWGFYKVRGWSQPNLVTYMESHDEERLMFKNLQFGNSSGNYDVKNFDTALDRNKMAAAFFFTLPGPKMMWQFGELGYDFSIDTNGRTGNKPIRWDYFQNSARRKLFKTFSALIHLRETNPAFRSDSSNVILSLSGAFKQIRITHPTLNTEILGNFGVTTLSMAANFPTTGTYYDFFSGDSIQVQNPGMTISLLPGEFHIYTDKKQATPETDIVTDIVTGSNNVPGKFQLHQNYPNPFNPSTTIVFDLPIISTVKLDIYNVLGQKVITLANKKFQAGVHSIRWNGRNQQGTSVASGIYILRMKAGKFVQTRRLLLIK